MPHSTCSPTTPPVSNRYQPPPSPISSQEPGPPPASAAETFWSIPELRYELFQWTNVIPKKQLAEMMVLEKKSLPEVAKGLYMAVKTVFLPSYLEERGCSPYRATMYIQAIKRINHRRVEEDPRYSSDLHIKQLLSGFPNLNYARFSVKSVINSEGIHPAGRSSLSIRRKDGGPFYRKRFGFMVSGSIVFEGYCEILRRMSTDIATRCSSLCGPVSGISYGHGEQETLPPTPYMVASTKELEIVRPIGPHFEGRTDPVCLRGTLEDFGVVNMRKLRLLSCNVPCLPANLHYFRQCHWLEEIHIGGVYAYMGVMPLTLLNDLIRDGTLPHFRKLVFRLCSYKLVLDPPASVQGANWRQSLAQAAPRFACFFMYLSYEESQDQQIAYTALLNHLMGYFGPGWLQHTGTQSDRDDAFQHGASPGSETSSVWQIDLRKRVTVPARSGEPGWRKIEEA